MGVPSVIAKWNRCKGRIDETTRKLDEMNFPMSKASPKQVLILRELKKLAIQVYLTKKNCFPNAKLPWGSGYRRIQGALGHSDITMKNVLHTLASTYEVINPIHGFTPGSPSRAISYHTSRTNAPSSDNDSDCNMINSSEGGSYRQLHSWKKEAKCYTRDVIEGSRNPFNKFVKDSTLDRIRKDIRLEHFPQSETNKSSARYVRRSVVSTCATLTFCQICYATAGRRSQ